MITRLRQLPMRHRWLRWAVLGASLAFGAGSTRFFYLTVQDEARSRFSVEALGMVHLLDSRVRAYSDVLYALRGLFDASERVTRNDFHEFAQAISLGERYPGLANISYSLPVAHDQKAAFEHAVRAETSPLVAGQSEFSIKPAGDRPEYEVLTYLEPMGKNDAAWGLDLNSDPLRGAAVKRARDSGEITLTRGLTLLWHGNSRVNGTILRLAVYRGKGVPQTIGDRRRLYSGTVGSAVRIGAMVESALRMALPGARMRIFNVSAAAAPSWQLLFDSQARDGAIPSTDHSAYAVTQRLPVGDHDWQVEITPLRDPVDGVAKFAVGGMLVASLAISMLLFWLVSAVATSEYRNAQRLRDEARFRATFDQAGVGVAHVDLEGRFLEVNRKLCDMTGYAEADLLGRNFIDFKLTEERAAADEVRRALLASGTPPPLETRYLRKDGAQIWMRVVVSVVRDPQGKPEHFVAMAHDVTDRRQAQEKVLHQAQYDLLTDLPNRALFYDRLEQALNQARRQKWTAGVMFVDLDKFKAVNDELGHAAGDALLREVARRLSAAVRASDTAARVGGDEFAVVLAELAQPGDAAIVARKILETMAAPMSLEGREKVITVSIGIALFPADGADLETLIRNADEAMFRAKTAGRNGFRFHDAAIEAEAA